MSAAPTPLKHTSSVGTSGGSSIFHTGLSSSSLRASKSAPVSNSVPAASTNLAPPRTPQLGNVTPSISSTTHVHSPLATSAPTASVTRPASLAPTASSASSHTSAAHSSSTLHSAHSSASRLTNAAPVRSIYDKPRASVPAPTNHSPAAKPTSSAPTALPSSSSTKAPSSTPFSSSKMADDVTVSSLLSDAQWAAANFPEAVNFSDFSVVGDMGSNCVASGSGGPSTSTSNSTSVGSHGSTSAVRNLPSIFEVLDDQAQIIEPVQRAPAASASTLPTAAPPTSSSSSSANSTLPADSSKVSTPRLSAGTATASTTGPVTRTTSNPFFSRSSSRIPPQPGFPSATTSTSSNITVTPVLTPAVTSTSLPAPPSIAPSASTVASSVDYEALYIAAQAEAERARQELAKRDVEKRSIEESFAAKEKEFGALRRSLENSTALQGDKLTSLRQELEKKKADIEKLQSQIGFAQLEAKPSPSSSSAASPPTRANSTIPTTSSSFGSPSAVISSAQHSGERSPDKLLKKRPHSSLSPPPLSGSSPSRATPSTKSSRLAEERALKFAKLRETLPLINQPSSTVLPRHSQGSFSAPIDVVGTSSRQSCVASVPLLALDAMSHVWDLLTAPSGPYVWLQSNAHIFNSFQDLATAFISVQAEVASFQHRKLALSIKLPLAVEAHHKLVEKLSSENAESPTDLSAVELVDFCLLQWATILSLFASIYSFAQLLVSAIAYQESQRLLTSGAEAEFVYPTMTPAPSKLKVEVLPPPPILNFSFSITERQALVQTLHLMAALGTSEPLTRALLLLPTSSFHASSESSMKVDPVNHLPNPAIARSLELISASSSSVDLFAAIPIWADSLIFAPQAPSALSSSIAPTAMIQPSPAAPSSSNLQSRDRRSSGSLGDNSTAPSSSPNSPKSLAPLAREIMEPLLLLSSGIASEIPSCSRLTIADAVVPQLSALDLTSLIMHAHGLPSSELWSKTIASAHAAIGGFIGSEALSRCLALHDSREPGMKSFTLASLTLSVLSHIAPEQAIPLNIESILRQSKSVLLSGWSGLSQDESPTSATWLQLHSEYGMPASSSERDCVSLAMSNRLQLVRVMTSLLDSRLESFAQALSTQHGSTEVDMGAQLVISLMLAIEEAVGLLINYWTAGPRFASSFDDSSAIGALKSGSYSRASPYALEEVPLYPHTSWLVSGACSPADMSLFADTLNFVQESSSYTIRLLRLQPRYATLTRSTEPELWNAYRSLEAFSSSVTSIEESLAQQSAEARDKGEQPTPLKASPLVMWMRNRLPTCIERLNTVLDDLAVIQERLARSEM